MHLITAEQVHEICNYPELICSLEKSHQQIPADLKDMLLSSIEKTPRSDNHFLVRAAWDHGSHLGLKAATIFPNNTVDSELPAIHAVYALFEGKTGIPLAVIDGTSMTYYKTAADSALGVKLLSNENISNLAMIGAGAMAPHLIRAHVSVRPSIRRVVIWNRTHSRAEQLADSLDFENVQIEASRNLEHTIRNAQLISSATMTVEPIISGQWLSPGAHLDLVGAFRLDMREADDYAMKKSRIFVDSRKTTIGEIGEINLPLESGIIHESDILGDLYELSSGVVEGRRSSNDVTLFKNGGGGHLDLMTAQHILDQYLSAKSK